LSLNTSSSLSFTRRRLLCASREYSATRSRTPFGFTIANRENRRQKPPSLRCTSCTSAVPPTLSCFCRFTR
jgi:hypothetical protein